MKTLGIVLAIVAVITATDVDIPEYSKDILDAMGNHAPDAAMITATLINGNVPTYLRRVLDYEPNELNFAVEVTEMNADQNICGDVVGINIHGVSIFCYADAMRLQFVRKQNTDTINSMVMQLSFALHTDTPLILEIPIYKTPTEYASDPSKLESWAAKHKVGTLFPLQKDSNIISDFKWLDAILKYGLYARDRPIDINAQGQSTPITAYVTRPVVLPQDTIQKLYDGCSWLSEDLQVDKSSMTSEIKPR